MEKEINKESLENDELSKMALGLAVSQEILKEGKLVIFIDIFGKIQLLPFLGKVPLPVLELNKLDEEAAIKKLLESNVSDEEIYSYLKERN